MFQIIEFPNFLQRTHKLYVDWDKKLSDMERLENKCSVKFLPHQRGGGGGGEGYNLMQRRANVERIRQLALQTPSAVMRLLKQMGCEFLHCHSQEGTIKVYVKEGTRPTKTESEEEDWKISFHFVFQVQTPSRDILYEQQYCEVCVLMFCP